MTLTSHRVLQYIAILLIIALFGVVYWYFQVRAAATLNRSATSSLTNGLVGMWSFDGADVSQTASSLTTTAFSYTGSAQTFTVPAGVTIVTVQSWGAGGGNGPSGVTGGAGGYASGIVSVTPGEELTIIAGGGGHGWTAATSSAYGGGGPGAGSSVASGGGGGRSAVRRASGTELITAGAGGGAAGSTNGGVGGGASGGAGTGSGGGGGTQSSGGAGGNTGCGTGQSGSQFQGGYNATTYGGGGGGGYYGGGEGGDSCGQGQQTGGGGGSGYIDGASNGTNTAGSGTTPPNTGDANYAAGIGVGGSSGDGGNGRIVISSATLYSALDRSGSGYNGTFTDSPTAIIGKSGQALDFDGSNDYVDMGDVLDVTDGSKFSISGWFYRDTATATHTIVAKKNASGTGAGYLVYLDATTDKLVLDVGDGTNTYSVASTSTFTAPGWYHFVAVWDDASAATTEIYINGTADNSTDTGTISSLGNLSNALNLRIGAESDAGNPFDGKLDEIRVYNRALSAGEIQSLYALGAPDKINSSVSTPQGTGRLDSGLSAYYAFDDNTGTSATDSSTRGNTGTLVNGPTWTTGQIGSAIDFDGTDDVVTAPDSPALDSTSDITVAVWAYADNWTGQGASAVSTLVKKDANYILRKDTDATTGGSGLKMFWWDGTNKDVLVVSIPSAGAWHHIVGINENNTTRRIYVDGILQSGTDDLNNTGTRSLTNVLSIGNHQSTGNESFDGRIDEVRIYNRALSSDEVTQLYRLTTPTGTDTGLKGYWSFNGQDLSGTTAYDRSGANNTGTLTNGPTAAIGKLGQALSFDGTDDYVNAGSSAILDDLATLTVSAWIKPTTSGEGNFGRIADKTAASTGWIFYMCADPGQANCVSSNKLAVYRDFSTTDGFWLSTTALTLGVWQHIAVTYDSSSASNDPIFYINGSAVGTTEVGTAPAGTAVSDAAQSLTIGNNPTAARTFNGSIDEVRLYSRILSATEIAALYNSGR